MEEFRFRPALYEDFPKILELNAAAVQYTAPMSHALLEQLFHSSAWFQVVVVQEEVIAFVLTLAEGKTYDSINYQWFSEQYGSFLYVDRIVVSEEYKGCGIGRMLYESVLTQANQMQAAVVAAEINLLPPNLPSLRFHEAFGFHEVGQLSSKDGQKIVSLEVLPL